MSKELQHCVWIWGPQLKLVQWGSGWRVMEGRSMHSSQHSKQQAGVCGSIALREPGMRCCKQMACRGPLKAPTCLLHLQRFRGHTVGASSMQPRQAPHANFTSLAKN